MIVRKRVAILATCSALMVSVPLYAQFGGLGTLKKVLEAATKPQPQPTKTPAPTVVNNAPAPARDSNIPVQQEAAMAESTEPRVIGQRPPPNLQSGPMPAAVKSGLMKVDSCVYFEDGQGQGTTVVEFVNYQSSIDTVVISDKMIFKNVGIEDLNGKSGVKYLGATDTDYYIKITLYQDEDISIIGKAWKQDFANDPAINFDFGNKKTAICYLEANNIG